MYSNANNKILTITEEHTLK